MKPNIIRKIGGGFALAAFAASSWAHEGHGMANSHWHATDSFGLLLVAGLGALAVWLSRGGK